MNYPSELMKRTMMVAEFYAEMGVAEKDGRNTGAAVEFFLSRVRREPGDAWCAAFVYTCIELAGHTLDRYNPPVKMTGLVKSMMIDAQQSNSFIPKSDLGIHVPDTIPCGAIYIVQYGDSGRGHTGFVNAHVGDSFTTIEGNHKNRVAQVIRELSWTDLKGFIYYP